VFDDLRLACVARRQVDEADDPPFESPQRSEQLVEPHLPLALGAGKGVGLIDLSDEVGLALSAIRSVSTV